MNIDNIMFNLIGNLHKVANEQYSVHIPSFLSKVGAGIPFDADALDNSYDSNFKPYPFVNMGNVFRPVGRTAGAVKATFGTGSRFLNRAGSLSTLQRGLGTVSNVAGKVAVPAMILSNIYNTGETLLQDPNTKKWNLNVGQSLRNNQEDVLGRVNSSPISGAFEGLRNPIGTISAAGLTAADTVNTLVDAFKRRSSISNMTNSTQRPYQQNIPKAQTQSADGIAKQSEAQKGINYGRAPEIDIMESYKNKWPKVSLRESRNYAHQLTQTPEYKSLLSSTNNPIRLNKKLKEYYESEISKKPYENALKLQLAYETQLASSNLDKMNPSTALGVTNKFDFIKHPIQSAVKVATPYVGRDVYEDTDKEVKTRIADFIKTWGPIIGIGGAIMLFFSSMNRNNNNQAMQNSYSQYPNYRNNIDFSNRAKFGAYDV